MSKGQLKKKEPTIDRERAGKIIKKAQHNGFHQASAVVLLTEARSIKHLRSLIGLYQRAEKLKEKDYE